MDIWALPPEGVSYRALAPREFVVVQRTLAPRDPHKPSVHGIEVLQQQVLP